MATLRGGLTALLLVLCQPPVTAIVTDPAALRDPRWIEPPLANDTSLPLVADAGSGAGQFALAFLGRHGGEWTFRVDPRTGRINLVQGSGIPLLPGPGNALDPAAFPELDSNRAAWTPEAVEPRVRAFVDAHAELLLPPRGELRFDAEASVARADGRLVSVVYDWFVDGIPVEGAGVFVRLNSGNVTQLGSKRVGPLAIDTLPAVDADEALRRVLVYSGDAERARLLHEPELLIEPETVDPGRLDYRLVWRLRYVVAGDLATWEARIDALSGAVVGFRDVNLYGRVVGSVYPRSVYDYDARQVPFPFVEVRIDRVTLTTDAAGGFVYAGGRGSATLAGPRTVVRCQGCTQPERARVETSAGIGWLDFGRGGWDERGNGFSTPAERNVFYHLNQAYRVAQGWLPRWKWLFAEPLPAIVNVDLTCNAIFNESGVYFFRSGDGCYNTGEISDIIYHEWAHALDWYSSFDRESAEGVADVATAHLTHSPWIGYGIYVGGGAFRNLDAATSPLGRMTLGRVDRGVCERPSGGPNYHCIGQVYGQAAWELARSLRERHGGPTGWRLSERLYFTSIPDAGSYRPDAPDSIYRAYLQADDDDGNLANGTPHAAEMHAAFAAHEIAAEPLPASPACPRPDQPALAVVPHCDRFELTWDDVEGAEHYELLRAELREDSPLLRVAEFPAGETRHTDREVAPGVDYRYVVAAVDASGCESTIENPVAARLPAQPILSVSAVEIDDAPRGNRSGHVDPGEEVDLRLTLANVGAADATSLTGTVRAVRPGLTVIRSGASWPDLPAGGVSTNDEALRFVTDSTVVQCGDRLRLSFAPDEASGCAGEDSYFDVTVGALDGNGGFVCDDTPPCFDPPEFDGLELAVPGRSCGEILLAWLPATSRCADATLTYDVYRSEAAPVEPRPEWRVAEGIADTRWVDSLLEPGRRYHYLVRAVDSRSGEERNAVTLEAVAPAFPDQRPPVAGAGALEVRAGDGCGEIELAWPPAEESCSLPVAYEIYRSPDPDFVPGPASRIGSSLSTRFVDVVPVPGANYSYAVRPRDGAGNEADGGHRGSASARNLDRTLIEAHFEFGNAGWSVVAPNDAETGNWEWGDPEGTEQQPEDDATPDGTRCWVTGLAAELDKGTNNDVDFGTTTLLSSAYDLSRTVDPVVRYMRWFTNDRGSNPGDPRDSFRVHVRGDDETTWTLLEEIGAGTPLAWVGVEHPLAGLGGPATRFRFTAADIGQGALDASMVEAAIDDFVLIDRGQGCAFCPLPVAAIGRIDVDREGPDVIVDWTGDPAAGSRFAVYKLLGGHLEHAVRIGTTTERRFVHPGGAAAAESFRYRVSAVDACGNESPRD